MNRNRFYINFPEEELKNLLLNACSRADHSAFLDSNNHRDRYSRFDWIVALGALEILRPKENFFEEFQVFQEKHKDWLFGHLCYDLKNETEDLQTRHKDSLSFPLLQFFVPETVIYKRQERIVAESTKFPDSESLLSALWGILQTPGNDHNPELVPQTSREEYLDKVASLKDHLRRGNIYEANYCIEFSATAQNFSPIESFRRLNESSQAPFAAFYKTNDQYLMCASPERYLRKSGAEIISQPIKGTAARSADPVVDLSLKHELYHNEKERSENVMITDLVRNDLSRTAADGSVKVEELFGIYSFNTVHQMITTISSRLDQKHSTKDLLETTFPMGSMTGAPKLRAMELIDEHENFARSLYSGSVGYITPSGDFDFNVVIRSLLYNGQTGYLSARVGSAITIHCEAEKEYEECLLKAANLFRSLKPEALASG